MIAWRALQAQALGACTCRSNEAILATNGKYWKQYTSPVPACQPTAVYQLACDELEQDSVACTVYAFSICHVGSAVYLSGDSEADAFCHPKFHTSDIPSLRPAPL